MARRLTRMRFGALGCVGRIFLNGQMRGSGIDSGRRKRQAHADQQGSVKLNFHDEEDKLLKLKQ